MSPNALAASPRAQVARASLRRRRGAALHRLSHDRNRNCVTPWFHPDLMCTPGTMCGEEIPTIALEISERMCPHFLFLTVTVNGRDVDVPDSGLIFIFTHFDFMAEMEEAPEIGHKEPWDYSGKKSMQTR